MKRVCSILLTVIMVFGLLSVGQVTSHAASVSDLEFGLNVDGFSYSVKARDTSISGELVIPDAYEGYPVTGIADAGFLNCANITSIVIPDTVTEIGFAAFSGCSGLTSISFPDYLTSIGGFYNCSSLTSIEIPSGVTAIDMECFYGCNNLESILIPNTVTNIGEYAFAFCTSLKSITLPDSVTNIDYSAFAGCENLNCITILASVVNIGHDIFMNCVSLKTINYSGSEEQWKNININKESNDVLLNTDIVFNYEIPTEVVTEITESVEETQKTHKPTNIDIKVVSKDNNPLLWIGVIVVFIGIVAVIILLNKKKKS